MGITSGIIGLAILGVVIIALWGFVGTAIINLVDSTKGLADAFEITPKPKSSEKVCDVQITVHAELAETLPFTPLFIRMGDEAQLNKNPRDYSWLDCHSATAFPLASLLDWFRYDDEKPTGLALFLADEKIHVELVLRSSDGTKIDAYTQPSLFRWKTIKAGIIELPLDMSQQFVVKNIPQRDYNLEVYWGRDINGMGSGIPFVTTICKSGGNNC